jgi:hypothetical protein
LIGEKYIIEPSTGKKNVKKIDTTIPRKVYNEIP